MGYKSLTPVQLVRGFNGVFLQGATTGMTAVTSTDTFAFPVTGTENVYLLVQEALPNIANTTAKSVRITLNTTGTGAGIGFGVATTATTYWQTGATKARNKSYNRIFGPFESGYYAIQGSTYTSTLGSTKSDTAKCENRIEFKLTNVTSTGTKTKASTLATQYHTFQAIAFVLPKP